MFEQIVRSTSTAMASKLDRAIASCLDRHWKTWTMDDVRIRCHLLSRIGDPVQTLYADSVPLLAIHPIEVEQVPTEFGWKLVATQKYRELQPAGKPESEGPAVRHLVRLARASGD